VNDGDRIGRATERLLELYPKLFAATSRSAGDAAHDGKGFLRNDPPGPIRVEVLDAIAETNRVLLDLHAVLLAGLGGGYRTPTSAGYRRSARVVAALQWLHTNAARWDDQPEISAELADVLEGLVRVARRLLGLVSATFDAGYPCPELLADRLEDDAMGLERCGGQLIVIVAEELATCRACGQRWHGMHQIEALGRQVRDLAAEAADEPAEAA
jgi:hypothetical protein